MDGRMREGRCGDCGAPSMCLRGGAKKSPNIREREIFIQKKQMTSSFYCIFLAHIHIFAYFCIVIRMSDRHNRKAFRFVSSVVNLDNSQLGVGTSRGACTLVLYICAFAQDTAIGVSSFF